jgi:FAD/FMN-containing dehydrogenase
MRGNHNQSKALASKPIKKRLPLALPFNFPPFALNTLTVKAFNELYYHAQLHKRVHKVVSYDPFFYPLDSIHNWYRMYGKRGFLQYQFVVPFEAARAAMREMLGLIRHSGEGSFLTVLKKFGDIPSPGMLSFPRPGLTLALDFAYSGQQTLQLLNELDKIVIQSGGAVYPAKDARMSAESFQSFFPQWKQFAQYIDPHFSSSFWRRVTTPVTQSQELIGI